MSDLVERLRSLNPWHDLGWPEVLRGTATEAGKAAELAKKCDGLRLTMSDIHREQLDRPDDKETP